MELSASEYERSAGDVGGMELSDSEAEGSAENVEGIELSASDADSGNERGAGVGAEVHEDPRGRSGSDTQGMSLSDEGESDAEMIGDAMSASGEARSGGARRICRQPLRPGLRALSQELGVRALPPMGCLSNDRGLEMDRRPRLLRLEPLRIPLQQADSAASLHGSRNAQLVPPGQEPVLKVYGTLRCFSATHRAAKVLTVRNQRELPEGLFFDPHFRKTTPQSLLRDLRFVSATFGEWLLGLPRGWTALRPVQQAHLEANRAGLAGVPGVFAGPPEKTLRSLSLFSGCGALDYALPWCSPEAFCEKEPHASAVLRARMADGCLKKAPLYDDVRKLTEKEITTRIDVIVAGFPCVDVSKAGRKLGLDGSESTLVREVVRLVHVLEVPTLFLENVDNFRFMPEFWKAVLAELLKLCFEIRWVSLSCTHIGCPQRRRRVFLLARRGEALLKPFAPPFAQGLSGISADPQSDFIRRNRGLHYNSGRPSTNEWMTLLSQYKQECHRHRMLGNAVVPLQANMAARILSSCS